MKPVAVERACTCIDQTMPIHYHGCPLEPATRTEFVPAKRAPVAVDQPEGKPECWACGRPVGIDGICTHETYPECFCGRKGKHLKWCPIPVKLRATPGDALIAGLREQVASALGENAELRVTNERLEKQVRLEEASNSVGVNQVAKFRAELSSALKERDELRTDYALLCDEYKQSKLYGEMLFADLSSAQAVIQKVRWACENMRFKAWTDTLNHDDDQETREFWCVEPGDIVKLLPSEGAKP